jgi:hypothetical protein
LMMYWYIARTKKSISSIYRLSYKYSGNTNSRQS